MILIEPFAIGYTENEDMLNSFIKGVVIYGTVGSQAEMYAYKNKITFKDSVTGEIPVYDESQGIDVTAANFPDANFRKWILENKPIKSVNTLLPIEIKCINELDINNQGIKDLTGIEYFTSLVELNCNMNNLKSLDLRGNIALENVYCCYNQLSDINITGNIDLKNLECSYNMLNNLDISNNIKLDDLDCSNNLLVQLDIGNNANLQFVKCNNNEIKELDFSKNEKLLSIECNNNKLKEIDVSHNPILESLECGSNQLVSLDLKMTKDLQCQAQGNKRSITLNKYREIDLSTIPGFDISRTGNWCGGRVKDTILTVDDNVTKVTYEYNWGGTNNIIFTLICPAGSAMKNNDNKTIKVVEKKVGKNTYKVKCKMDPKKQKMYAVEAVISSFPTNIKNVKIADTITIDGSKCKIVGISSSALKKNKKLKIVKIGNNVKSIGNNAFYGCTSLQKVSTGKNLTTIGSKAFYGCKSLKSIVIPEKVTKIGKGAFYGCQNLKKITIKTKKLTSKRTGSKAFVNIHKKVRIKVPKSKKRFYKKLLKKRGVSGKLQIIK